MISNLSYIWNIYLNSYLNNYKDTHNKGYEFVIYKLYAIQPYQAAHGPLCGSSAHLDLEFLESRPVETC